MRENLVDMISRVASAAEKEYCAVIGKEYEDWQDEFIRQKVYYFLGHPDLRASEAHDEWVAQKIREGWRYSDVPSDFSSPMITEYDNLPIERRRSDYLFLGICRALVFG